MAALIKNAPDLRTIVLRKAVDARLLELETIRWSWWSHWRVLGRYIQPRLGRFISFPQQGTRGAPKNQHIVNSTATIAAQRFGAGMLAGTTNPARPWFKLMPGGTQEEPTGDVRAWLDEVRNRLLHVFEESNFYDAAAQVFEQEGVFGTAVAIEYEDFEDVARFQVPACGEYFLACNNRLEVDTLYRRFLKTPAELIREFGEENVSPSVLTFWKNNQPDKEIIVAHALEPNDDRIEGAAGFKGMPWREVYWEWGQSGQTILRAKGYHEKPFMAPRWNVTSNDPYGRSCGMDALGDVIQIQLQEKRKQQAIDKVVNPPMIADARLRNEPASTISGGVTYAPPGIEAMKPMYQIDPRIDYMEASIAKCEGRVKSAFFEDLFLMISNIDRDMTAYEVSKRQEEKMLMLGPPLERNHGEFHRPAIERTFGIMSRVRLRDGSSLIPPPPSQLSGRALNVKFTSMLAQAQQAVATTSIERTFAFAGNIAGIKPDVMDNLDADQSVRDYADLVGVPTNIIVPEARMVEIRTQRAQQQQAQLAIQTGMAAATGAKTLSETDVGGGVNALQRMMGNG